MKNNFFTGLGYLIDGFELILKPGLKRYMIIPLAINTLLFIGVFLLARHYFLVFDQRLTNYFPSWLHWLNTFFWLLFMTSLFIVFIYTFATLANLVSAPFNSLLAEKVELYLTGKKLPEQNWLDTIWDIPRMTGRQFAVFGYYLPRAIVLLTLFFIPFFQMFTAFFWVLFNAWFMALQYIDYPADNHKVPFAEVRAWQEQRRWVSLGFGLGVSFLMMVPILDFVIVPVAVAAATKLWLTEK